MIASNSFSVPRTVSAEPASITWIVAISVAAQAVAMKRMIFTRADRHADVARHHRVAAGGVDPVAEPRSVSTQPATSVTTIHQTIDIGMPSTNGDAVRPGGDPVLRRHPVEEAGEDVAVEDRRRSTGRAASSRM